MPFGVDNFQSLFYIFHTDASVYRMAVTGICDAAVLDLYSKPVIFYRKINADPAIAHIIANAVFKTVLHQWQDQQWRYGKLINRVETIHGYIQPFAITDLLQLDIIMNVFHFLAYRYKLLAAVVQHITQQGG